MALCRITLYGLVARTHYIRDCRSLSRIVKTDQFKIYKVDDAGAYTAKSVGLRLRYRSEQFKQRISAVFSEVFRLLLPIRMSNFTDNCRAGDLDVKSRKLCPPAEVRGMKKLDRSAFTRNIKVLGMKVPFNAVAVVSKRFKDALLKIPRIRPIVELSDTDPDNLTHKLLLFDPRKYESANDFSEFQKDILKKESIDWQSCKMFELTMSYENWLYDGILDAVLPESSDGVGGFSTVGHIAHLNLRDDLLEYKHLIGEVLLDKISAVKTVVNKLDTIDNTFRNFQMEVLAGDENFVTLTREHGISYEFDFSKVYWNPRLSTEHQRVVNILRDGDVVFDMFAGVGPFAIPAAKRKCTVYANDLNPESYRWLDHNTKLNKVSDRVHLYNMDGRQFVKSIVKKVLLDLWNSSDKDKRNFKIHVIMNLPAIAIEFLDAFRGLVSADDLQTAGVAEDGLILPNIHCYCFSKSENVVEDATQRVERVLGEKLPNGHEIRLVRNVAPNKEMLCVAFEISHHVLFASDGSCNPSPIERDEPVEKRCRLVNGEEI